MKNSALIITAQDLLRLQEIILDSLEQTGLQIGKDFTLRIEETESSEQLDKAKDNSSFYFDEMTRLNNELTNMQRALAKSNAELNKLAEIRNRFVGMAAHDLRNPIGIVKSFSEVLITTFKNSKQPDNLEVAEIIHSTAIFMQNLVDGVLDVSTLQSGTVSLKTAKTDLDQLFTKIVETNQILAQAHDIKIIYHGINETLEAEIDRIKIHQVINNLIGNAIKYSPTGRSIICRTERKADSIVFCVKDEGPGISAEDQKVIFDPFKRLSNNEGLQKSAGLGLSIAKNIIAAHSGKIWVESEVGKGAEFCFSLPM